MLENSMDIKSKNVELDVGIKGILAILLMAVSAFCQGRLDFIIFSLYLLAVTILLRSDLRFILKNLISYGVIFILPYFLGLLLSLLAGMFIPNTISINHLQVTETLIRLGKVFFIWYIGSLYFFTTPFEEILIMLKTVLSPLNAIGIPILKYLNMMMCIMNELTESISRFKMDILEEVRHVFKDKQIGFKVKLSHLANILVSFIANSLQKTDAVQKQVETIKINVYVYKMRFSKNESLGILSFILLLFFLQK
ncbi:hypothetical protein [Desulfitobacterium sp. AusDCA]|uniref:hypothetical protein n=1 Tax=Desulfitobacterium sp. AusDCA TaxID=3240383 RepID=UPI003DA74EDA